MSTGGEGQSGDLLDFCRSLVYEIVEAAPPPKTCSKGGKKQPLQSKASPNKAAVRLKEKSSPDSPGKASTGRIVKKPLIVSESPKRQALQSSKKLLSPYRAAFDSPEPKQPLNRSPQRTPSSSRLSPALAMRCSPTSRFRKGKVTVRASCERLLDKLVTEELVHHCTLVSQLRDWGDHDDRYRTHTSDLATKLESLKSDKEELESVLGDLEAMQEIFPSAIAETIRTLKMCKPVGRAPFDFSIAQAQMEMQQTINSLTYKKLLEVSNCHQPSPELVTISLLLYRLILRLVPTVSQSSSQPTWKSFQAFSQQPGSFLSALKSTYDSIDLSSFELEPLPDLRENLAKFNGKSLEMYDKTGTGVLFLRFLQGTVRLAEARSELDRKKAETPTFFGADMPSRKKLLTSLYQRVFQGPQREAPHPRSQIEQISRIFCEDEKPGLSDSNSLKLSYYQTNETAPSPDISVVRAEELSTEQLLNNISFRKEEEGSQPVTLNPSPDRDRLEDFCTPVPMKSEEAARTEPKRSKSTLKKSGRSSVGPRRSSEEGMKKYWDLESAFRKFLQEKVSSEGVEDLCSNRVAVVEEFRRNTRSVVSAELTPKEELLFKSITEEQRFREEARQAFLITQRHKRISRQKSKNWMQQVLQRDKAKLAQGMERFATGQPLSR